MDKTKTLIEMLREIEERSPIAFPHAHFMSLAPLDVWARLLASSRARIPPKYWLRLFTSMWPSVMGTAVTLPERLAFSGLFHEHARETNCILRHDPGVTFVLGYFRSGTTHLHYLLNCDPQFFTPKWFHVSAPHGYVLSWAFLRLFMIPFLAEKRPQDDVSFGPDFPAEDDFALNNLSLASTLPGRLVLPRQWERFKRFHDLQNLSAREFARWRFGEWSFLSKMARLARDRGLLLKSPSHTARIPELLDLCGGFGNDDGRDPRQGPVANRPKFIHIARDPESVIRSNIRMLKRLSIYHFQERSSDEVIEERVVEEYVRTEERYLATRELIPKGHLVEIRYDDLVARPREVMRSVYDRLGLEWTDGFEMNLEAYLASIRDYQRAESQPTGYGISSIVRTRYSGRIEAIHEELARGSFDTGAGAEPMVGAGKDEPPEPVDRNEHPNVRMAKTVLTMVGMCMVCIVLWLVVANAAHNRYDWLVWPTGIAVGYAGLRVAGAGTMRLGLIASVLTLTALLGVSVPNTRTIYYRNHPNVSAADVWDTTTNELTAGPTIFWALMGMVTAYRFASRSRIRPGNR